MSYILDEDFTGPAGTLPSSSTWNIETGPGSSGDWGANNAQYYVNSTNILYQDGGSNLIMKVGTVNTDGASGGEWPSARLNTQGKYAVAPGQSCEIRVKINPLQGLWPADWFLKVNGTYLNPDYGEIDMQESGDSNPNESNVTIWGCNSSAQIRYSTGLPGAQAVNDGNFHIYRLDLTTNNIAAYIDGSLSYNLTAAQGATNFQNNGGGTAPPWPFNDAGGLYVILNTAVAPGNGFGTPNAAQLPWISQTVDYVRIWSPAGPDPNTPPSLGGITQHEHQAGQAVKLASIY
jgi:beta-glucanase (GH16 family)